MSIILGIFDSDLEYSSQLMNYIKRKQKNINQVRIFTNKTILYDFLLDNKINVLLISEDKLQDDIEHDNIDHMCILSEGNVISENNNYNQEIIYKYQAVDQIIRELFDFYPELSVRNTNNYNKLKIISIFSLNEKFAKDSFSYNLANQFAIEKKTLLVNLNLIHGRDQYPDLNSDKNLSEFLYFLKSTTPNMLLKMNDYIQKIDNFDYLMGVKFGPDLYDLTSEDLEFWLKELQTSSYEAVIFNIGCYMESILELFRRSNEIFLISSKGSWDSSLYDNFIDQLTWTGFEDVNNKLKVIEIQKELTDIRDEYDINGIFTDKWGDLVSQYARDN